MIGESYNSNSEMNNQKPVEQHVEESITMPQIQPQDPNLVKYQLENDEALDQFVHKLKGEFLDINTGKWYMPLNDDGKELKPQINQKGINALLALLRLVTDKNVTLSWSKEDDIKKDNYDIIEAVIELIARKHQEFGVKDTATAGIIRVAISQFIKSALYRAKEGEQYRGLKETQKTSQVLTQIPNKRNYGGMFSLFNKRSVRY